MVFIRAGILNPALGSYVVEIRAKCPEASF